jgi:hypothetical protein
MISLDIIEEYNMKQEVKRLLQPTMKVQQFTLSGDIREDISMKNTLGYLPLSILNVDWQQTKILKAFVGDNVDTRKHAGTLGYTSDNTSTSMFNPYICKCLLNGYAPKNADIYDPFAGGGTRAIISTTMGHTYTGCEIRQEEVDVVNKRGETLGLNFTLMCKDACEYINEKKFNFSLTCPPYYNLEQYNGGERDLSMAPTYSSFMNDITKIMKNVYISLKPDSYCIWIVGNFRDKNGALIDFRGDVVRSAKKSGFIFHDDIVIHSASGNAVQRVGHFKANKKSVRIHEYALIFKKL